jgi:GT2 family glycosyltransferase
VNKVLVFSGAGLGDFSVDDFLGSAGLDAVRASADDPRALETAKETFTRTALAAVLFVGADAVERLFSDVRHTAGSDQSLVCFLPDAEALRGLPRTSEGLKRRELWREVLRRADEVWTASPADAAWLKARFGGGFRASAVPSAARRKDWAARRLAAVAQATRAKDSYGSPADLASIVIPALGDGARLKRCLDAVRRHTPGPHEVLVVDNGAGSTDLLAREKGVKRVRGAKDLFFAGGANLGLRAARGRYLVLLSAGAVVTPRWLELLVRRVKRDPSVGLAGPYTNRAEGAQRVARPGYKGLAGLDAFAREWTRRHAGGRLYPPRLSGSCLLIRRETLAAAGLLDERFGPGGLADDDYCLRVRQAGWRLLLAEEVYVHDDGGEVPAAALRRRSRALLAEKWSRNSLAFLDEVL